MTVSSVISCTLVTSLSIHLICVVFDGSREFPLHYLSFGVWSFGYLLTNNAEYSIDNVLDHL